MADDPVFSNQRAEALRLERMPRRCPNEDFLRFTSVSRPTSTIVARAAACTKRLPLTNEVYLDIASLAAPEESVVSQTRNIVIFRQYAASDFCIWPVNN